MPFQIRPYQSGEESQLRELFFHTIRTVNLADYTPQQVEVWAPADYDQQQWQARIAAMQPRVCLCNGEIVGYAGLLATGHIDHFYVHHRWQRQGVGSRLYQSIETLATEHGHRELTSDVSITAKAFFQSRGFHVVTAQQVKLGDQTLLNFRMSKQFPE